MRDFAQSLESNDIRQDLLSAVHGHVHSVVSKTRSGDTTLSLPGLPSAPTH